MGECECVDVRCECVDVRCECVSVSVGVGMSEWVSVSV